MRWLLFICLPWAMQAQGELQIAPVSLDQYPSQIGVEVFDRGGVSLFKGFFSIKSVGDVVQVPGNFPEIVAIQSYEDANGNKEMDRGFFGQPTEKYAFSNGAWKFLGKPDLDVQLISIRENPVVRLTYKWVTEP